MTTTIIPPEVPQIVVDVLTDGQTVFDYDFLATSAVDLKAVYTNPAMDYMAQVVLLGGTDFTVVGIDDPDGGTITIVSGLVVQAGGTITIYRDILIRRENDYQRDLHAVDLNREMGTIFQILQQLDATVDLSVKVPPGSGPIVLIPGDAGTVPVYDEDGNLIPGAPAGGGNMFREVYDLNGVGLDVYERGNMSDGPEYYGAVGDGVANDTAKIISAISAKGAGYLPYGFTYFATGGAFDLRNIRGPGKAKLSNGQTLTAEKMPDRGDIAQRYYTEVKNTTNNSTTQSIAVHKGKLYRCQQNTIAGNMYAYDTTSDITQMDLPAGNGRSRSTIDYTSDAGAQLQNYSVTIKGLGHGDGIALFTDAGGVDWVYGHCSAPLGSLNPDAEANGFVKFPWLGAATALEPVGAVFYRNLQGVTNPNFGMSSDGKWLLFVQRDVDPTGVLTNGNGSITTYRVVVHSREAIEAAGPGGAPNVVPFSKFVVTPNRQMDTIYAQAGITSDGKYIYVTFSGARVVGKTFLDIYTMTGDFVKSIITSGIRAENAQVYSNGVSGWLPAFYETEGLTVHEDKVLTASRYLFTSGSPVVTWTLTGENFVYIGTAPSSGNAPNNVGFWAPTKAAATAGAYNPATVYTRGAVMFHHYITAFVTGGVYGSEEFAVDADPHTHPYVENSFNGMVTTRTDYNIGYNALNTRKTFPIVTHRTEGEHYFYNAEKQATGEHTITDGLKLLVSDDKTDLRLQSISGLANCGAVLLGTSTHATFANQVLMYTGASFLAGRFATAGLVMYGYVRTALDNTFALGASGQRWTQLFAATTTINTSDERVKTFLDIEDAERAAALEIKANLRKFKFNDAIAEKGEDGARIHFGVAAQQVGAIMESHGLDASSYGFFCYDEWEATPDVFSEGQLVEPAKAAGNLYGVRYSELLCFILAAI